MMWLSGKEQAMLTALGVAALAGLGVLGWQRQRPPPLVMERAAMVPIASTGQVLDEQPVAAASAQPRSRRRPTKHVVDASQSASWDRALEAARRVDVNTAGASELERLPNVGPALAERIVAYREAHGPFLTTEELRRVRGVGPATFQAFRDSVTIDGDSE